MEDQSVFVPASAYFCQFFASLSIQIDLEQPLWGSTPDTLGVHSGPMIWAWLLKVLAGWLTSPPAGAAG